MKKKTLEKISIIKLSEQIEKVNICIHIDR